MRLTTELKEILWERPDQEFMESCAYYLGGEYGSFGVGNSKLSCPEVGWDIELAWLKLNGHAINVCRPIRQPELVGLCKSTSASSGLLSWNS